MRQAYSKSVSKTLSEIVSFSYLPGLPKSLQHYMKNRLEDDDHLSKPDDILNFTLLVDNRERHSPKHLVTVVEHTSKSADRFFA